MKSVARLVAATLAAAVSFSAAYAADMNVPIVVDQAPEFVPVEVGNGWYLRGDIGYSVASSGGAGAYRTCTPPATYGSDQFDDSDIETDWSGGIGVGYHFSDMLRVDVTGERFKGDFFGGTSDANPCPGGLAGTSCASNDSSEFTAYSVMANAYVDLATIAHVTPYVGAGVGMSYVSWDPLVNTLYCVDGAVTCPPGGTTSYAHEGLSDWRLTYALMAGASYQMTRNTALDFGYRWRHVEGGDFFAFDTASITAGAAGTQGEDDGFDSHEFRVGLRYDLW
jgi:opacity protein-like surface antigen